MRPQSPITRSRIATVGPMMAHGVGTIHRRGSIGQPESTNAPKTIGNFIREALRRIKENDCSASLNAQTWKDTFR